MIKASDLIEKFRFALDDHWGYIWGTKGIEWTKARQTQKVNYMKSKYGENWQKNADAKSDTYYSAAVYGSKWIGHRVADCSGLFAWAFAQLGGSIAHGSNSIYARYCTTKGAITDSIRKTMIPGTAVFVDKNGNKSHIGLYVGNGKVIEAAGTQAGVCTSNLSAGKWTYYGLLKNVEYPASEAQEQQSGSSDDKESSKALPTLKKGNKGEYVTLLQTKLIQKGYDLGKWGADGDFGAQTEKAVKAFQKDNGLTADGIVGAKTWDALQSDTKKVFYSVVIPHLTLTEADAFVKTYAGAYKEQEVG